MRRRLDKAAAKMTISLYIWLTLLQFSIHILGLQVTPNSPCASVCLDNPKADISDPNSSNTYGSDIVCTDADYSSTAVGQKFEQCINCLQNSTANSTSENDQEWFLYNVRYAFNTCLFKAVNASQPFSTPCSISTVCGSLDTVLETGTQNPSLQDQYGYCGAKNDTFSSFSAIDCGNCLRENSDQLYLSNFLIALDAGCIQQPKPGVLLGLEGSLFSTMRVNITAPVAATTPTKKNALTVAGISGITAAGVVVLLTLAACIFISTRKRKYKKNLRYKSGLDDKYGSSLISVPVKGAYNDPTNLKSTAYESVGLIKIPPPIRTSIIHDNFSPPANYTPEKDYFSHRDPNHNHEELARKLGFRMSASNSELMEEQSPLFTGHSRSDSIRREGTPITDNSSLTKNLYDRLRPLPLENSIGTTSPPPPPTRLQLSRIITTSSTKPARTSPPITGFGLPKPQSQSYQPKPPQSEPLSMNPNPGYIPSGIGSSNNNTALTRNFSRRHTRDLSISRETDSDRAEASSRVDNRISGPIVVVASRFDEEAEARRRVRERLYREGFSKRQDEGEVKSQPGGDSPDGTLW